MIKEGATLEGREVAYARIAIGVVQGFLLYLLYTALHAMVWPATNPYPFLPLVLCAVYVPLAAAHGFGHVRGRVLAAWLGALALIVAGLSYYAVFRDAISESGGDINQLSEVTMIPLLIVLTAGIFMGHTLLIAAQSEARRVASYQTHFDLAWKHAVQIVAAGLFVGAAWALLFLSAALFKLVRIDLLYDLFTRAYFAIPATTVMISVAWHITDVRPGIVAGIRTLALTLLSWLLPLMAVIVASFLLVLPLAGIELLWATNYATALLLVVAAVLIVLINAVYQDGLHDQGTPRLLQYAASLAALLLAPLTLLSVWGLGLRVMQYGWTGERMVAAACIVVAGGYAAGYAWAVLRSGAWLSLLERWNIGMSYVALAVLFALFTPIADPTRISVNSQVERLRDGRTAPEEFDFAYLRFDSGRHGLSALAALERDEGVSPAIRQQAADARATYSRRLLAQGEPPPVLTENIEALPAGKAIPESFLVQDWSRGPTPIDRLPECLQRTERCHGLIVDVNRDGIDEVVLTRGEGDARADVFQASDRGWRIVAQIQGGLACPKTLAALREKGARTVPGAWDDVDIGGRRLQVQPETIALGCD